MASTVPKCTCKFKDAVGGHPQWRDILFCPLHLGARDLYEALENSQSALRVALYHTRTVESEEKVTELRGCSVAEQAGEFALRRSRGE